MVEYPILKYSAFTLIELIFSILIIGIAVVSLPYMSQVSSNGMQDNLNQEAIFAASTEISQALSGKWDENSVEPNGIPSISRVINVDNLCSDKKLKIGHIDQVTHRRCLQNNTTLPSNTAGGIIYDLNDAQKTVLSSVFYGFVNSSDGYKREYKSTLNVVNLGSGVKELTVKILYKNKLLTSLSTYSCNIGEVTYHHQEY